MIYIGMDVSSKEFVIYAIDQRQQKVFEGRIAPSRAGLRKWEKDRRGGHNLFVFEAGNQMKWIALTLMRQEGVRIHVVHPNEIKRINQSSGKTDKVDARKMAQLARGNLLPRPVHVVEGDPTPIFLDQNQAVLVEEFSSLKMTGGRLFNEPCGRRW
jgi:transposase